MAKTDGSLQIQIPDEKLAGGKILWNRQYYVVPLEVHPSLSTPPPPYTLSLPSPLRLSIPLSVRSPSLPYFPLINLRRLFCVANHPFD